MTTSGSHTVARLEAALHSASSANSDPAARCIAVNRIAADIVALRHVDTFPGGSNPEAGELARVEALAQMILGQINADVTALLTVAADRKRQTVNYKSGRFNLTAFKAAPWVYLRSARQTLKEKENEAGREEPSAKEQFKHYSDSKAELLRTVPTASNRETVHDDDAFLLKEQRRLQEEYSADLARMAERLKDNSLMFTDALKADKEVLENTQSVLEANFAKLSSQSSKLGAILKRTRGTCFMTIAAVLLVCALFAFAFVFMKLFRHVKI